MRMNKIGMTFCDFTDIIDENIDAGISTHIICDEDDKDLIAEYMYKDWGLEDSEEEFDEGEYYIEIVFDNNDIKLFIESARGNSGNYKSCEYDGETEYYILNNMDYADADKYLKGDNATCMFCEILSCDECEDSDECEETEAEDDFECDEDCENCPYGEDEENPEYQTIADYANDLVEAGICPDCAVRFVVDIWYKAKQVGFDDCRLGMIEMLSDEDED